MHLVAKARALEETLRLMVDTAVTGLFTDNWTSAISGNRFYKIRSKQTVLATGAFDQPLVFGNNDRPRVAAPDPPLWHPPGASRGDRHRQPLRL